MACVQQIEDPVGEDDGTRLGLPPGGGRVRSANFGGGVQSG